MAVYRWSSGEHGVEVDLVIGAALEVERGLDMAQPRRVMTAATGGPWPTPARE
jgi:hypothetical protein